MAEDEIQEQPCKFPRVLGNGRSDPKANSNDQYPDNEIDGQLSRRGTGGGDGGTNRFNSWNHHSSRIIRVPRASGGKDRHSKVMTSKGSRDRRVRLSVTTAIQFYDLQDRLGYDQPSKAVEWLIKAAQDAIAELPSLNDTFPESPTHPSDDKRASLGAEQGLDSAEIDGDGNYRQNQSQNLSLSKSACSSTSETSKGSGLSLSRSEIRVNRVKARERARERAAKEKEKESESRIAHNQQNVNPISQTASFTELLTSGIGTVNPNTTNNSPTGSVHQNQNHPNDEANLFNKGARQQHWISPTMDYFNPVILGSSSTSRNHHHQNSGFPGQIQLGNALNPQTMSISPFNVTSESHSDQLQQFAFIPDHLIPVSQPGGGGGDYSLNFSISSSGLAGFNRGTLQSNSPSLLPHHLQRFSPIDGSSNVPFFIGATASAAPSMENHTNHHHHQFSPAGFDGRGLQLCYGDGSRHSDQKGKGKN